MMMTMMAVLMVVMAVVVVVVVSCHARERALQGVGWINGSGNSERKV